MAKLLSNKFVSMSLKAMLVYAVVCLIATGPWLTGFVSAALVVTSMLVWALYLPDAVRIIKRGELGDGELALLAVTVLAWGSFSSGLFGLVWTLSGQPQQWLGTWFSNFGRACMVPGFFLLMLSPNATREGIKTPPWYLLLGAALGVALIGYLFGAELGPREFLELMHNASR